MPSSALCASVSVIDGLQGSGRSDALARTVKALAKGSAGVPVVIVDPLSCWSAERRAAFGTRGTILRGRLATSADLFDVLAVLLARSPGLIIGVDDAEHCHYDRRRWSSLTATVRLSGSKLVVVLPSFSSAGDDIRSLFPYPGGPGIARLAAVERGRPLTGRSERRT